MIRVGIPAKDIHALLHSPVPPPSEGGIPKHSASSKNPSVCKDAGNDVSISAVNGADTAGSVPRDADASKSSQNVWKMGKWSKADVVDESKATPANSVSHDLSYTRTLVQACCERVNS